MKSLSLVLLVLIVAIFGGAQNPPCQQPNCSYFPGTVSVVGSVNATNLYLVGPGPTRFFMTKGAAPTNTVQTDPITGLQTQYDAVLFLDVADGILKVRFATGTVATLGGP